MAEALPVTAEEAGAGDDGMWGPSAAVQHAAQAALSPALTTRRSQSGVSW